MACKYLHVVNSIDTTTTANTVILNFSVAATAVNQDRFCMKIPCCMSIPTSASTYAVQVTVNGSAIPLWDKYGNPLTASELSSKRIYKGYYGSTTPHVIINAPMTYNCGCNNVLM